MSTRKGTPQKSPLKYLRKNTDPQAPFLFVYCSANGMCHRKKSVNYCHSGVQSRGRLESEPIFVSVKSQSRQTIEGHVAGPDEKRLRRGHICRAVSASFTHVDSQKDDDSFSRIKGGLVHRRGTEGTRTITHGPCFFAWSSEGKPNGARLWARRQQQTDDVDSSEVGARMRRVTALRKAVSTRVRY